MSEKKERKKMNRKKREEREKGVKIRMRRDLGARAGTGLTMVVIALALCVFVQSALAAQISVVPECQIVAPGEYLTVNLTVYPEESEVFAASYTLYFNNTLLNATSQVNGSFLSQDGASTHEWWNVIDNISGKTEYAESRKEVSYGVTENDTLATITFQAIADGFCELRLSDLDGVILADPNYTSIPTDVNNGSVRIGICGDVDNGGGVTTGDAIQIFNNILHGPEQYPINNPWAADVDGGGEITTGDAIQIFNNILHGPVQYPLNCRCP